MAKHLQLNNLEREGCTCPPYVILGQAAARRRPLAPTLRQRRLGVASRASARALIKAPPTLPFASPGRGGEGETTQPSGQIPGTANGKTV